VVSRIVDSSKTGWHSLHRSHGHHFAACCYSENRRCHVSDTLRDAMVDYREVGQRTVAVDACVHYSVKKGVPVHVVEDHHLLSAEGPVVLKRTKGSSHFACSVKKTQNYDGVKVDNRSFLENGDRSDEANVANCEQTNALVAVHCEGEQVPYSCVESDFR